VCFWTLTFVGRDGDILYLPNEAVDDIAGEKDNRPVSGSPLCKEKIRKHRPLYKKNWYSEMLDVDSCIIKDGD